MLPSPHNAAMQGAAGGAGRQEAAGVCHERQCEEGAELSPGCGSCGRPSRRPGSCLVRSERLMVHRLVLHLSPNEIKETDEIFPGKPARTMSATPAGRS